MTSVGARAAHRRVARPVIATVAVLACLGLTSCHTAPRPALPWPSVRADAPPATDLLVRGPVVQRVTPHGVSILGKPVGDLLNEQVAVTVTPEGGTPVSARGKFDPVRDTFLIRVDGLPANTVCQYEVTIKGKTAGPFNFVTALAPDDKTTPFRFAVYGDTRSRPDKHEAVAYSLLGSHPRFTLVTGDLVTSGRNREQWDTEFFGPTRAMGAHVDMIPCYGNHDEQSPYLTNLFDLPGNGHYFTIDYGYVRIITIDQYQPYGPASEQYEWLEKELSKEWDGWLFCQFHQPPFGANPSRKLDHYSIENLFPLLLKHGVDVVFCGHDHHYVRTKPIALRKGQRGIVELVAGGGGAPTYKSVDRPYTARTCTALHHVVIDVTPERLTGKAVTPTGRVIDRFVIEKDGPQPDLVIAPETLAKEFLGTALATAAGRLDRDLENAAGNADIEATLVLATPLGLPVRGSITWDSSGDAWSVEPTETTFDLGPDDTGSFPVHFSCTSRDRFYPAPVLRIQATAGQTGSQVEFVHTPMIPNAPTAEIVGAKNPPQLDGGLSDPAWGRAGDIGPFWREDAGGRPKQPTEVRALAGVDGLYLGITCFDDDIGNARALAQGRDSEECWRDDSVLVFIDGRIKGVDHRMLVVSITGDVLDSAGWDRSWNGTWQAAVKKSNDRWTVELRVPWADLGLNGIPPKGYKFGFNVLRPKTTPRKDAPGEWDVHWAMWSLNFGDFHREERFGTLTLAE